MRVYRGIISNAEWHYNGSVDALKFTNNSDNPISLLGFSIFTCASGSNVDYKIYKNGKEIMKTDVIPIEGTTDINVKHKSIYLPESIFWNLNEDIEIVLHQVNNNRNTCKKISSGINIEIDDIKIIVSNSKFDHNSTSKDSGAIPYLIIDRPQNIPLNIFCKQNYVNLLNHKNVNELIKFATIDFQIESKYFSPIESIIEEYIQYIHYDKKCKTCNNQILELDRHCEGKIFKNPKNSWGYKNCCNNQCEDCTSQKTTIYHLHKEEKEEKVENVMDEDNIDLHNPGLFEEDEEDEEDEYTLTEMKVCNDCYEHNKENNDCKMCHRVYNADSCHYQKCNDCELKRVCRLCMVEDFVNNKCKFCQLEN